MRAGRPPLPQHGYDNWPTATLTSAAIALLVRQPTRRLRFPLSEIFQWTVAKSTMRLVAALLPPIFASPGLTTKDLDSCETLSGVIRPSITSDGRHRQHGAPRFEPSDLPFIAVKRDWCTRLTSRAESLPSASCHGQSPCRKLSLTSMPRLSQPQALHWNITAFPQAHERGHANY